MTSRDYRDSLPGFDSVETVVDPQTGLTYRKRKTHSIPRFNPSPSSRPVSPPTPASVHHQSLVLNKKSDLEESSNYISSSLHRSRHIDTQSEYSVASTLSFDAPRPPPDVPVSDYYKYTSRDWTPLQKVIQILVWIAGRETEEQDRAPSNRDDIDVVMAKRVAREMQLQFIKNLANGHLDISWVNRPPSELTQEEENPADILNKNKLSQLEASIKEFQNEISDWKQFSGKIYQAHAEAKDTAQIDANLEYDEIDTDSMLEHLDEVQQQFYEDYCKSDEEEEEEEAERQYDISSVLDIIDPGVTQIRQSLNTANRFVVEVRQYSSGVLADLAKKESEKARIVPIEQDHGIPSFFGNSEEKRKESENRNVQNIIRLLTRTEIAREEEQK